MCEVNCSITYRLFPSKLAESVFVSCQKEIDYQVNVDDDASEDVIDKQIKAGGIAEIKIVEGEDIFYKILDLHSSVVKISIPWQ